MNEWMEVNFEDVIDIMSEQNNSFDITLNNYISTDNMLPDCHGITVSSSLPKSNSYNSFKIDDVLFSNIRTYFRKIWQATFEGYSSKDVLVFRSKDMNTLDLNFLYYLISDNRFSNYTVVTAKGCKMPRGDKDAINKYSFTLPLLPEQKSITAILSSLDNKIENLRQQNQTLEKIAQTLFKHWFVDFEFPNEQGIPYKSSSGKMIDSELGPIPESWRVGSLGEIIINHDSKRIPLSSNERDTRKGSYPYYGATSIMDYIDDYLFDGTYLLMGEDGSVVDNFGHPIIQYISGKFWVNNHAHVIQGQKGFPLNFIYLFLKKANVNHIITGAVQPKINQKNMNSLEMVLPSEEVIILFNSITKYLFNKIESNNNQIQTLTKTRDTLLPKLMSGEKRIQIG